MTKLEEIARAIDPVAFDDAEWVLPLFQQEAKDEALNAARAAVEAMVEPTPGMIEAAWRTIITVPADVRMNVLLMDSRTAHSVKMLNRFRAMITAILSEHDWRQK